VFFFVRRRSIPPAWRQLGWVILAVAAYHCLSALAFAWKYPLWDWRVFKTKYMAPAVLWIPYAVALVFSVDELPTRYPWLRRVENLAFYALVAFVALNHLLPVY
jgi:hypothetical protein